MRVRIAWPFPQDLLHSDHSVHSDMMQSMAEEAEYMNIHYRIKQKTTEMVNKSFTRTMLLFQANTGI